MSKENESEVKQKPLDNWMEGFDEEKVQNAVDAGDIYPTLSLVLDKPIELKVLALPKRQQTREPKYGKTHGYVMPVEVAGFKYSMWLNNSARFSLMVIVRQIDPDSIVGKTFSVLKRIEEMEDTGETQLTKFQLVQ